MNAPQTTPYRLRPIPQPGPGRLPNTLPIGTAIDGINGLNVRDAKTLYLSSQGAGQQSTYASWGPDDAKGTTPSATVFSGQIVLEVVGLMAGLPWLRLVSLGPYETVEMDISTFRDVRVNVVSSSLVGFDLLITTSSEVLRRQRRNEHFYGQTFVNPLNPAPGVGFVPPGAVAFIASAVDAGFGWRCVRADGAPIVVPQAVAIGVRVPVQSNAFQTTIATQNFIWEIAL